MYCFRYGNIIFPFHISDKPSPPQNLKVTNVYKDRITIAWETPKDDGGSEITGYVIEKRDARRTMWSDAGTCGADTLKSVVSKLSEGNDYFFRVAAQNKIGTSDFTELPEAVTAKLPFGKWLYKKYNLHLINIVPNMQINKALRHWSKFYNYL